LTNWETVRVTYYDIVLLVMTLGFWETWGSRLFLTCEYSLDYTFVIEIHLESGKLMLVAFSPLFYLISIDVPKYLWERPIPLRYQEDNIEKIYV